jgi:2-polyprenyl-3-methyl-5-hydroxy-6-metoxy-1,4-benzoquinol methylase
MKSIGWDCTALDLDPRSIRHAQEVVGVEGFCGDLDQADGVGQFNAVTLNRVLEHVVGPREMLAKVKRFLLPGGFVYVEVPDGEMAAIEGPEREEFGIDHWHIFSATSLALLISRSGFVLETLERLRDPSGKFTLRAFIVAPGQ